MAVPKLEIKDQTVKATTSTTLEVNGKYTLNGRAMKFVTIASDSTFTCGIDPLSVTIGLSFKDVNDLKVVVELKSGDVKLHLDDFERSKVVSGMVNSILKAISGVLAKFMEESISPALQNALQKIVDQHKAELAR